MITIFTPTYNREKLLPRLYESLCSQTNQNFEWLVVDDGSSDGTLALIEKWRIEGKITLRLLVQKNAGKHIAINTGVTHAGGEIFFIVDSDDYISTDAVEIISEQFKKLEDIELNRFAGIAALCVTPSGDVIGGDVSYDVLDTDVITFRYSYKIQGDKAEAFYTAVLRQFPFPFTEGEKFCPEALVWNRIGSKYILRNINAKIYVRDYQQGGLTSKIVAIRKSSPVATSLYYKELAQNLKVPLSIKLKSAINFWRFSFYHQEQNIKKQFFNKHPILSLIAFPIALFFKLKD